MHITKSALNKVHATISRRPIGRDVDDPFDEYSDYGSDDSYESFGPPPGPSVFTRIAQILKLPELYTTIHSFVFPGLPEHYPLKKKMLISKTNSFFGAAWDINQVILSLVACALYVAELYSPNYDAIQWYGLLEMIFTQFFLVDFLFNWYISPGFFSYFLDPLVLVDVLTIAPIYINMIIDGGQKANLSIFRFVRILRLIRILRAFRLLSGMSGVKRQLITLVLTLLSLIFLASGIVQLMENDVVQQLYLDCNFISEATLYEPSCSISRYMYNDTSCDCRENNCIKTWGRYDSEAEPSVVTCNLRSFLECFYYIIVTISTVGYGDFTPTHDYSKGVTLVFIITSMALIPLQVNQLSELLRLKSAFREPYVPTHDSSHIIVCGHVNSRSKLERFSKEFFHPDRTLSQDIRAVVLMTTEPSEDVRDMLLTPEIDQKITILIGSPLNATDLVAARADIAIAMFFLCDSEVNEETSRLDDALTVLCTLSVSNFNPQLECLVQMMKPGDRDVLKDSNVDTLICLDELKTILMARNSICHGLSTFVELLFLSFGTVDHRPEIWFSEYVEGAGVELYYVPMNYEYIDSLDYEWTLLVEGIFIEYEVILLGVCNVQDHKVCINPTQVDFDQFSSPAEFYSYYNVGVMVADEQSMASAVGAETSDYFVVDRILKKIIQAEKMFACRIKETAGKPTKKKKPKSHNHGSYRGAAHERVISELERLGIDDIIDAAKNYVFDKKLRTKSFNSPGPGVKQVDPEQVRHNETVDLQFTGVPNKKQESPGKFSRSLSSRAFSRNSDDSESDRDSKEKTHEDDEDTMIEMLLHRVRSQSEHHDGDEEGILGLEPGEVQDGGNLHQHVIVTGSINDLTLFCTELRKAVVMEMCNHAILVVSLKKPPGWDSLVSKFSDVYWLRGDMLVARDYNRSNIRDAYSLVFLANTAECNVETSSNDVDSGALDRNLDAENLFAAMKLERYVPSNVFFSVELICSPNIAVLNSSVMKRYYGISKMDAESQKIDPKKSSDNNQETKDENEPRRKKKDRKNKGKGKSDIFHGIIPMTTSSFLSTRTPPPRTEFTPVETMASNNENNNIITRSADCPKGTEMGHFRTQKKDDFRPSFWDATNSHHILPVFAAGKAFVPSTFDSLLCQSFFTNLTPLLCEAIVRGQRRQTIFLVDVPRSFHGRPYLDLFRALNSRNVLAVGLYRAKNTSHGSLLPFVFSCPKGEVTVADKDRVYVYANPELLKTCMQQLSKPLQPGQTQVISWFLGGTLPTGYDIATYVK